MFDEQHQAAAVIDRITAAARAENQAAGARLVAIGELDTLRNREGVVSEQWALDRLGAVATEVAAALTVTKGLACGFVHYARAMRDRLPRVGELLSAGVISYWMFVTIVFRTDLIEDPEIMAAVDATLATKVSRWSSLTRGRLGGFVDKVVARADRDAVRQRREQQAERAVAISHTDGGLSQIYGWLSATAAHALDARLDALAATVCSDDPRTLDQRRADALGALANAAERLTCRCGRPDCPAAAKPAPGPVLIHVIGEQASLDGRGDTPGSMLDVDALVPPELLAELAAEARCRPLIHPGDAPPESGYVPSAALADFVRCRDMTCRFPGCDEPATNCDLDHTIAFGDGGPTHASNMKALCRKHHLAKTFLRWQDQQLVDGTIIWRAPTGHTYVTSPGSALLFPHLCTPTGDIAPPDPDRVDRCGDRTAMMPTRRRTRAQNHARYVAGERSKNRQAREKRRAARQAAWSGQPGLPRSDPDDDPPPF